MSTTAIASTPSFMEFPEAFRKHFRVVRNNVIWGRSKERPRGRWALARVMAEMGFQTGVEIGVMGGASAEIWCTANPQLHLVGIDPFGPYRKRGGVTQQDAAYAATCKFLARFNVEVWREFSLDVVHKFDNESLDFINIDGDHSFDACMADLIAWVPKIRKGGIIAVHDYCAVNWHGVTQAVNAYLFAHQVHPWYATFDTSPTVFWQKGAERA